MLNPPLRSVLILKVNRGGRNRPPRRDFTCGFPPLLSYAELFDYRAVTLNVNLLKISEKIAAVSDHLEKTAAAVVILLVGLKMLGKGCLLYTSLAISVGTGIYGVVSVLRIEL